jgi:hypothetical protein
MAVATGFARAIRLPTTDSTPTIRWDIANSASPSLALLSFASWKTQPDRRAFFIARSLLTHVPVGQIFSESAVENCYAVNISTIAKR